MSENERFGVFPFILKSLTRFSNLKPSSLANLANLAFAGIALFKKRSTYALSEKERFFTLLEKMVEAASAKKPFFSVSQSDSEVVTKERATISNFL